SDASEAVGQSACWASVVAVFDAPMKTEEELGTSDDGTPAVPAVGTAIEQYRTRYAQGATDVDGTYWETDAGFIVRVLGTEGDPHRLFVFDRSGAVLASIDETNARGELTCGAA